MLEAELTGVQSAIANLTERGAVDPVVKATVTLSDSGFIAVKDAIADGIHPKMISKGSSGSYFARARVDGKVQTVA